MTGCTRTGATAMASRMAACMTPSATSTVAARMASGTSANTTESAHCVSARGPVGVTESSSKHGKY
jgi:hypothetical protein